MSQYSLSTCNPLKAHPQDRRDVRRPVKLESNGSVLFETGTISTRADSYDIQLPESIAENEDTSGATLSEGSSSSEDGTYPVTPTKFSFAVTQPIFGGVIVESPVPSRQGTMDEETAALLSSSTPLTSTRKVRRVKRKAPPPLLEVPARDEGTETPLSTPTTPTQHISRAIGTLAKAFKK